MDLKFGDYRLNAVERRLVGPDGPVELSARSFDILTLLLSNPDAVVRKDQIFDAVWSGLVVEENTLQVHISALRKSLGSGMIMTVHGQGYKFTGPRPEAAGFPVKGDAVVPPTVDGQRHPMFDMQGGRQVPVTGGCLCGDIRYRITGPVLDVVICHCRMCQKFSGSAFSLGVVYATECVNFTKGQPLYYRSAPFSERGFCQRCGSSLSFRATTPAVSPEWEGWILIEAGTMDDPNSIRPAWELGVESQLPWLDLRLGHKRVRCQDSPDVVEAWAAFDLPVP